MSTEVLRPRDCLVDRIQLPPTSFHNRRKGNGNGNNNTKCASAGSLRKSAVRFDKKVDNCRSETKKSPVNDSVRKNRNCNNRNVPTMGQVTILKRGEPLDLKIKAGSNQSNLIVSGTERIGPDPDLFSKQFKIGDLRSVSSPISSPVSVPPRTKRVDIYAGSAVSISPSPNSLPLPSFFSKKQVSKIFEDSATRDLCRLLRLE